MSMRKIKEVLRLRYELKLDQRQVARSCSIAVSTVHEYLKRAEVAQVGWPLPEGWDETRWKPPCTRTGNQNPGRRSRRRTLPPSTSSSALTAT